MRTTVKVDLTKQTKQWNRVQVASAIALFYSLDYIVTSFFDIIKYAYTEQNFEYKHLLFRIPYCLLALFMFRQTWKHGSMFNRNSLNKLGLAFGILAFIMLLFSAVAVVLLLLAGKTDLLSLVLIKRLVPEAIYDGYAFIGCVLVTIAIGRLMGSKIDTIGMRMRELLDGTLARANEPPPEAYSLIRIDQPKGLLWILLGAVVFIFGAALGSVILDYWLTNPNAKGDPYQLVKLSALVEIGGAMLLLKGRTYFTPKTEAVLAIDKRAPILYLRSFLDETPDNVQLSGTSMFIDRSLEMKLARYFLSFGPFLAIGSPQDALPKLGAMRLIRSDDEWQGEVMNLMKKAQIILASVGRSQWIKWELAENLRRGFEGKSLFIFPVTIRSGWWLEKKQAAQQAERIDTLRVLYGPTEYPNYDILEPNEFLLAQVTTGTQTILVTTRKPGSNSQLLSAVVGHYLLGQGQGAKSLAEEATGPTPEETGVSSNVQTLA